MEDYRSRGESIGEDGKRKQRRYRTTFTADQLDKLEKVLIIVSNFY